MSRDGIKLIAMITMLLNHIGYIFCNPPLKDLLMDIGYFTAIAMCYFLVEGYGYSRSKERYGIRLFVFALLSQVPYSLALTDKGFFALKDWNMVANLFLCFLIIHAYHVCYDPQLRQVLILLPAALSVFCDWSCMAPMFVLLFLLAGRDKERLRGAWRASLLIWGLVRFLSELTGSSDQLPDITVLTGMADNFGPALLQALLSLAGPAAAGFCILYLYNGKKSPDRLAQIPAYQFLSKWFFYLFYPVHLLVLGILKYRV